MSFEPEQEPQDSLEYSRMVATGDHEWNELHAAMFEKLLEIIHKQGVNTPDKLLLEGCTEYAASLGLSPDEIQAVWQQMCKHVVNAQQYLKNAGHWPCAKSFDA
jgi:hypothetical protein